MVAVVLYLEKTSMAPRADSDSRGHGLPESVRRHSLAHAIAGASAYAQRLRYSSTCQLAMASSGLYIYMAL